MYDGFLEECDANPCPWCGEEAVVYLGQSGAGDDEEWWCNVECSDISFCGARGPRKKTEGLLDEGYEIQGQVIELWNAVSLRSNEMIKQKTIDVEQAIEELHEYLREGGVI